MSKQKGKEEFPYQDLLDRPCPISTKHPPMPIKDRAAQFAPFAALTGHREVIEETRRMHEERFNENRYDKNSCRREQNPL